MTITMLLSPPNASGEFSLAERLRRFPLFSGLAEDELSSLAAAMELRRVRRGACVLKAEDPGQFIMFVLAGRLKVVRTNRQGREFVLDTLQPGDFFGELALLTGKPRAADVEADEESEILVLAQRDFEERGLAHPALLRALLRELAMRFRAISVKAGDVALFEVSERLLRVLCSLAQEQSLGGEKVRVIEKRPTHRELAALTATSREVVTKALRELESAGRVVLEGKKLILRDARRG